MAESHALKLCVAFEEKQQAKQTSFKRLQMFFTVLFERQLRQISHLRFFAKHILKNAQVQNTCKTILQKNTFFKTIEKQLFKKLYKFLTIEKQLFKKLHKFQKIEKQLSKQLSGPKQLSGSGEMWGLRSFLKTFKPSRRHCHGW